VSLSTSTSLASFDNLCSSEATAAALPGTYKAFLATSNASAASRFTARGVPVYRPDGAVAFDSDTTMFSATGMPETGLRVFADGTAVQGFPYVVTGATDPTRTGGTFTCSDWQDTTTSTEAGETDRLDHWFLGTGPACSFAFAAYCLQQ
jgi:hypothetical protein